MWSTKHENYHRRPEAFADTSAVGPMSSTTSPQVGEPRLRFLVHTRLVVNDTADEDIRQHALALSIWPETSGSRA